MANFTYSAAGLALTKGFEGLRLEAYQDSGGVWTIGYGHTGHDVGPGEAITEAEAETLLRSDVAAAEACVNAAVTAAGGQAQYGQAQFDALVDFAFNCGRKNFLTSRLLRDVNAGDVEGAAAEFLKWIHAAGKTVAGLVNRRSAERLEFLQGMFLQK